jgi:hypothetical protein
VRDKKTVTVANWKNKISMLPTTYEAMWQGNVNEQGNVHEF